MTSAAETAATIDGAESVIAAIESILTDLRDRQGLDVATDELGFHVEQALAAYETGADAHDAALVYASRIEEIASDETWELAREIGLGWERDLTAAGSLGGDEVRAEYLNGVVGSAFTEISDLLLEHAHRVRVAVAPIADAA